MDKKTVLLIIVFVLSGTFYYYFTLPPIKIVVSRVVDVIDGDTLVLGNGLKIRLLGINTPEKNQLLYREAKDFLTSEVLNETVRVEVTGLDKYNRSLGYVFVNDDSINEKILSRGLATTFFYGRDEYYDSFMKSEAYARSNSLGLWDPSPDSACITLVNFVSVEPGIRCSNGEVLVLKNSCNKTLSLVIKDDATHIFKDDIFAYGVLTKNFSCVFNDDGDSLYVYDTRGLILFSRYD